MRIGFSGTREGATPEQLKVLTALMKTLCKGGHFTKAAHGDCIGADEQFHEIATILGCFIVVHPCNLPKQRAFCIGQEKREPMPPLERNHNIVRESDIMLICPGTETEILRSGSWATWRYAVSCGKLVHLILPSGEVRTSKARE